MATGWLPATRATLAFDLIALALVVIVPLLTASIYAVRVKKAYVLHYRLQLAQSVIMFLAFGAFEIEVRLSGWRHLAEDSPYYETWLMPLLGLHVSFAFVTVFAWATTLVLARRRFDRPPRPGAHSVEHRRLGRMAALGLYGTALTGWLFYWMAFVA